MNTNFLYGAGRAAEKSGDKQKALSYYRKLVDQSNIHSDRYAYAVTKKFIRNNK